MMEITEDMIIGDVMAKVPGSVEIFRKHFKGCFTCPGSNVEDIAFGALMHNADLKKVLKELNELANKT
jgi:hybrid cluster-associated redox disulfide protein